MDSGENAFEVVKAREMLRLSEALAAERKDNFAKTKERASSIFGWALAVEIALVGFLVSHPEHSKPLCVMLVWCGLISIPALCVLWPVAMKPYSFSSTDIEDLVAEHHVLTEDHLKICMSREIENSVAFNDQIHSKLRSPLRLAWIGFGLLPLVALVANSLMS